MDLSNYSGIIISITIFLTIGFGHVLVRKLNYHTGTKLAPLVFLIGFIFIVYSIFVESNLFSAVLGISAITILFDGYELYRQEERVKKGIAPENPKRKLTKDN